MRGWKWLGVVCTAALIVALAAPADAQQCPKGKLRIYTSWPMQGAMIPEGTAMLNAANEVAVAAFLDRKISFPAIARVIEQVMEKLTVKEAKAMEDVFSADEAARVAAREFISS